ncbi:MAG: hypothetical protein ACTHMP_19430, partial [Thermomicrobiales bacterium]
ARVVIVGQSGSRAVGQWVILSTVFVCWRGADEGYPGLKSGATWRDPLRGYPRHEGRPAPAWGRSTLWQPTSLASH